MNESRAFVGLVCDSTFVADYQGQYRAHLAKLEGEEVVVEVMKKSEAKTRLQEKGFHAMITPWCREKGHDLQALKRYLLAEIFGYREEVSKLDGQPLLNEPHTGKLSKANYSHLIEETMRIAAEKDDFYCVAPDEYRRAKDAAHRKAEREARRRAA